MLLRLPYLPPYLNKSSNFNHGINFAVGGATALGPSFFIEKGVNLPLTNSSLNVQIQWFKSYLNSTCNTKGCAQILERALFLIGEIGGNDYNHALLGNKSIEEVKTYVPHVVNAIVHAIKEVINLGATQLIVPGNFPIGCFPIYLTAFGKEDSVFDQRNCLGDWNEFAEFHNKYLQSSLNNLRRDYPNVLILYGDYYNAFLQLMDEANSYGFDQSSLLRACCRLDFNHTLSLNFGTPNGLICSDPSKFINWDGVHLTQKAYKNMAKQLFQRWAYTHASF
uniref:GDSL esterase/lipase At5g03980 n=1 Tax=Anthurium amnicola TaxID=1678845 RepID=A0A1D1ZBD8_9ARAE